MSNMAGIRLYLGEGIITTGCGITEMTVVVTSQPKLTYREE